MDKSKRSQILKLSLIASLFIIYPLVPTMFKSTYLYFLFNLLILAICAEAGLVSFFSKSIDEKKHTNTIVLKAPVSAPEGKEFNTIKPKVLGKKCLSEKITVGTVRVESKVKKCPSTPSIFFIGNCENNKAEDVFEEHEEEEEVINEQELFTKAEIFIGNFYKQLKMQREDSWNKIHGFYQKAF